MVSQPPVASPSPPPPPAPLPPEVAAATTTSSLTLEQNTQVKQQSNEIKNKEEVKKQRVKIVGICGNGNDDIVKTETTISGLPIKQKLIDNKMEKDNVTTNSGVNKKSTVIYTSNQLKQTNQQQLLKTLPKNAKIVYSSGSNKLNRDLQKTTVCGTQKNNTTFVAARLVAHKVPVTLSVQQQQQQQQQTTTMTTVSGQPVGNLNQSASKVQVTFDALTQQMSNKPQQTPSPSIIQSSIGQQKIITPSTIKTITAVSNLHRMPTKSPIPNNGQRTEAPTTAPVNNQVMIQKDGNVTRVQLGKVQLNSNIMQTVPVSINQVLTTAHVQRVNPTNIIQKDTTINQKQIIQDTLKAGNNSKIQVTTNIPIVQQKTIIPQKTLTVQGHQQLQQHIGNIQKIPVAGIQKISIQNQQIINNSQTIDGQQTLKLHVKNSDIDKSGNITESKAPSTVTINTGQPIPTTHQVTLQQLTPQFVQIQQSSPLQTTRLHGNTTLTTLSANQKVSNITNLKNQQQQLVFKLNPAKNTGESVQFNVKPAIQKSVNVAKDLQGEVQQQQQQQQVVHQNTNKRSIENVHLVELGQKSGVSPKKRQKQAIKKVLTGGKVTESWETGTTHSTVNVQSVLAPVNAPGLSNSTNVVTDKVSSDETLSVIKQSQKETTRSAIEDETISPSGNYVMTKNPQGTVQSNNEVLRQTLNNSIAKQNQKQQLIRKSIEGLSTSDDCFSNMNPLEALAVTSAAVIANQSPIDTTDNNASSIGLSQETTSCIKTSLNTNMTALETLAVVTSAVNANTQSFESIDYQTDNNKQKGRNKKQTICKIGNNNKKITTPTTTRKVNFNNQMSALCEAANIQALEQSGYQSSSSSPDIKIKGRKKQTCNKVNNWDNSNSPTSRRVNTNKIKTNLLQANKNSVKTNVTTNTKLNEQLMNNIVSRERQQLQQKYNNTMLYDNSLRGVKKPMGIKTSLNTDMNPLKTLAVAAIAELTTPKTNIKTILPHQKNPPTMMTTSSRNQQNKIQQQQFLVTSQYSHQQQQVKNSSPIRCKPHIPVTLSPETCRDIDRMLYPDETDNITSERDIKKEIKTEFSSSPRPLLPHEVFIYYFTFFFLLEFKG